MLVLSALIKCRKRGSIHKAQEWANSKDSGRGHFRTRATQGVNSEECRRGQFIRMTYGVKSEEGRMGAITSEGRTCHLLQEGERSNYFRRGEVPIRSEGQISQLPQKGDGGVHYRYVGGCVGGFGGGLKIHCRQLRVGSNPTADI